MCGRYTLKTPASRIIELFHVISLPSLFPRYNIAPTTLVLCIRQSQLSGDAHSSTPKPADREAILMKWGLVPFWADDLSIGSRMINARSETASEKPAFRTAMKRRRCLIIADGFYEWEKTSAKTKQPWYIHLPDQTPFAMAGLWESWTPKPSAGLDPGDEVLSCTILTTSANAEMAEVHDRMPVILMPEQYDCWLSPDSSPAQRESLLRPLPDHSLQRYRISTLVNKPGNDTPECIAPLDS